MIIFDKLLFKKKAGFTLIELLIYISILGVVLVLITGFFWNIILGYTKENSYQEIQQNGRFLLTKITQEIKKSKRIISPAPGFLEDSVLLEMEEINLSPTIFKIEDNRVIMIQGSNNPVELTSDRVIINKLDFTNLSYENAPGTLRIEIKLEHLNPGNIIAYQSDINLTTTVSINY